MTLNATSRAIAAQSRHRAVDLTPWAAQALPGWRDIRLPEGYRLSGLAKTPRGPFLVHVFRPGEKWETHRDVPLASYPGLVARLVEEAWIDAGVKERCSLCGLLFDSREAVAVSLQGGALASLCIPCQDRRADERWIVQVDADGWIRSIENDEGEED